MSGAAAAIAVKHGQNHTHSQGGKDKSALQHEETEQTESSRQQRQAKAAALCKAVKWQLRIGLIRAQHLPKVDIVGSADPFVTLQMAGQEPQKSPTIKNTLSPDWTDKLSQFEFNVRNEKVMIVCYVELWLQVRVFP